jgi:glycosyltransferase involved in cell wall biosynthesis
MAFALSIVVPVYNGASSIPILVNELTGLEIEGGLEIVLVNDCSVDNSLEVCRAVCRRNNVALTVVNLARNYGEHNAVMAGLGQANGAYIVTMDDDLQNPPEEVVRLWRHARDHGYDVVYGYYAHKRHPSWRNFGSRIANACADRVLDKPKGVYLSTFRCMSDFIVRAVLKHTGPFPYIDGLITQVTQNIGQLQVAHLPRLEGQSNYTIRRLVRLFLSIFLNFSVMPLRVATLTGLGMTIVGSLGLLGVFIEALTVREPRGWASLMAVILLVSGVQLVMLGLIGEYLGRMFLAINQKPQVTVRDIERNDRAVEGMQ